MDACLHELDTNNVLAKNANWVSARKASHHMLQMDTDRIHAYIHTYLHHIEICLLAYFFPSFIRANMDISSLHYRELRARISAESNTSPNRI